MASGTVVGGEEQRAIEVDQAASGEGEGAGAAGVDVLDQDRPSFGPVALPQLGAVGPVVGREVHRGADGSEVGRVGGGGAGVDVLDEGSTFRGAVADVEFSTGRGDVGSEVHPVAHRG